MIKIIKNNPNIPINKVYPYTLKNSWDERISCTEEELKELYNALKDMFYPKPKLVDFSINCGAGRICHCKYEKECKKTYLDCLKYSREDFSNE